MIIVCGEDETLVRALLNECIEKRIVASHRAKKILDRSATNRLSSFDIQHNMNDDEVRKRLADYVQECKTSS